MLYCIICKDTNVKVYDIYECVEDNILPVECIIEFFGDVKKWLWDDSRVCLDCLFVIRKIIEFRTVLLKNLKISGLGISEVSVPTGFRSFLNDLCNARLFNVYDVLIGGDESGIGKAYGNQHIDTYMTEDPTDLEFECTDDDGDGQNLIEPIETDYDYSDRAPSQCSKEVEGITSNSKKRRRKKGTKKKNYSLSGDEASRTQTHRVKKKSKSLNDAPIVKKRSKSLNDAPSRCSERIRSRMMSTDLSDDDDDEDIYQPLNVICPATDCLKIFETFEDLLKHAAEDHAVKENDVCWEKYEERLENYKNSQNNVKVNKLTEKYKYPCLVNKCFKEFDDYDNLCFHKYEKHKLFAKFICEECPTKKFCSKQDLEMHRKFKHNFILMNCLLCSTRFININELQEHLEKHKEFIYPCKYCDKYFISYDSLNEHHEEHISRKENKKKKKEKKYKSSIVKRIDAKIDLVLSKSKDVSENSTPVIFRMTPSDCGNSRNDDDSSLPDISKEPEAYTSKSDPNFFNVKVIMHFPQAILDIIREKEKVYYKPEISTPNKTAEEEENDRVSIEDVAYSFELNDNDLLEQVNNLKEECLNNRTVVETKTADDKVELQEVNENTIDIQEESKLTNNIIKNDSQQTRSSKRLHNSSNSKHDNSNEEPPAKIFRPSSKNSEIDVNLSKTNDAIIHSSQITDINSESSSQNISSEPPPTKNKSKKKLGMTNLPKTFMNQSVQFSHSAVYTKSAMEKIMTRRSGNRASNK